MVLVNLVPGDHTIEWAMDGYETLTAIINVSVTGIVSCISVFTGICADFISIVGTTVTGLLKLIIVTAPVCDWISSVDGWQELATIDIMNLIQGYLNIIDLGFTVSTAHIMGAIAYYNNQMSSGNALTGCEFT